MLSALVFGGTFLTCMLAEKGDTLLKGGADETDIDIIEVKYRILRRRMKELKQYFKDTKELVGGVKAKRNRTYRPRIRNKLIERNVTDNDILRQYTNEMRRLQHQTTKLRNQLRKQLEDQKYPAYFERIQNDEEYADWKEPKQTTEYNDTKDDGEGERDQKVAASGTTFPANPVKLAYLENRLLNFKDVEEECPVCFGDVSSWFMVACSAAHRICLTCFRDHVLETVRNGQSRSIGCFEETCTERYSEEQLKGFLSLKSYNILLKARKEEEFRNRLIEVEKQHKRDLKKFMAKSPSQKWADVAIHHIEDDIISLRDPFTGQLWTDPGKDCAHIGSYKEHSAAAGVKIQFCGHCSDGIGRWNHSFDYPVPGVEYIAKHDAWSGTNSDGSTGCPWWRKAFKDEKYGTLKYLNYKPTKKPSVFVDRKTKDEGGRNEFENVHRYRQRELIYKYLNKDLKEEIRKEAFENKTDMETESKLSGFHREVLDNVYIDTLFKQFDKNLEYTKYSNDRDEENKSKPRVMADAKTDTSERKDNRMQHILRNNALLINRGVNIPAGYRMNWRGPDWYEEYITHWKRGEFNRIYWRLRTDRDQHLGVVRHVNPFNNPDWYLRTWTYGYGPSYYMDNAYYRELAENILQLDPDYFVRQGGDIRFDNIIFGEIPASFYKEKPGEFLDLRSRHNDFYFDNYGSLRARDENENVVLRTETFEHFPSITRGYLYRTDDAFYDEKQDKKYRVDNRELYSKNRF